jgi:membrane protease YdiL (CAAX protease family)
MSETPSTPTSTAPPTDRVARRRAAADAQRAKNAPGLFPDRVPWVAVVVFLVVALGGAWAFASPLWFSGEGLTHPLFGVLVSGMMFTPALAALVVVLLVRRPPNRSRYLGLSPLRPAKRTWGMVLLALVAFSVLPLLAMLLGRSMGLIRLDFTELSGFTKILGDTPTGGVDVHTLALVQVLTIPVFALINCLMTFGEELGWRGWLLPTLRPLGTWPALTLSGAIWGVWHAPIILLGYNYQRTDLVGVLLMVVWCVLLGVVIGWTRLRTASVWPAVMAHAAVNAATNAYIVFIAADDLPLEPWGTLLGWSGWILLAVIIAVLALTGQLRKQPAPGLTLAETVSGPQLLGESPRSTAG